MCLNETYSKVRIGKHLSDSFPIHKGLKQGDALSPLLSPRQFNHLDYIAQFTSDVRHISGQDNVVADALSRVESITAPPSHDALAAMQESDDEVRIIVASDTALRLEKQQIPDTAVSIYCDTSVEKLRP
jgi:cleavage and polyadenylation specificity factor subunit 1